MANFFRMLTDPHPLQEAVVDRDDLMPDQGDDAGKVHDDPGRADLKDVRRQLTVGRDDDTQAVAVFHIDGLQCRRRTARLNGRYG